MEVCEEAVIGELSEMKQTTFPIILEILMDQNFPFNAPKLYAKTNVLVGWIYWDSNTF